MAVSVNVPVLGAIPDYTTLLSTVAAWLNRDDLTGQIPTFIALCEQRLNRILRVPEMESVVTTATASDPVALPADFLAMRTLYMPGSPDRPLRAMSPSGFPQEFSGSADTPVAYCIRGKSVHLAPPPSGTITLSMDYYAKIPALSVVMASNWLLADHADIYLYGTLLQAEAFISNPEAIQLWKAAYDEAIGELVTAGNGNRWGAGPLVPNTVVQVRGARC